MHNERLLLNNMELQLGDSGTFYNYACVNQIKMSLLHHLRILCKSSSTYFHAWTFIKSTKINDLIIAQMLMWKCQSGYRPQNHALQRILEWKAERYLSSLEDHQDLNRKRMCRVGDQKVTSIQKSSKNQIKSSWQRPPIASAWEWVIITASIVLILAEMQLVMKGIDKYIRDLLECKMISSKIVKVDEESIYQAIHQPISSKSKK